MGEDKASLLRHRAGCVWPGVIYPKTLDHFSISPHLGASCSLTCCFRFPFSLISYGWVWSPWFFSKMELKQRLTSDQSLFGYPVTWICNLLLCLKNWVLLTVARYRATELKTACFNIAEVSRVKISLPAGQALDLQHLFRCRWWDNCGSVLSGCWRILVPSHKPVSGSVCKPLQCGLEKQMLDCKCSVSFAPSQGKPFST